jgi:predicted DsbA family dithiol-disulfide isomerase
MAIENEHITADVVEVSEFIDMAQLYQVRGVPKTVVNERIEIMGAVPEPRFLQEVLKAIEPKEEQP